jgi:hypothetical protein
MYLIFTKGFKAGVSEKRSSGFLFKAGSCQRELRARSATTKITKHTKEIFYFLNIFVIFVSFVVKSSGVPCPQQLNHDRWCELKFLGQARRERTDVEGYC